MIIKESKKNYNFYLKKWRCDENKNGEMMKINLYFENSNFL